MKIFDYLKERNLSQVLALLNSNIDVNLRDEYDNYLIQYAVLYNMPEVVKKLISMGCKLDVIDKENHTICYTPIKYGHHDIISLLLSYNHNQIGINLHDFQDNNGNTPLHFALFFDNKTAFDKLLPKSNTNLRDNLENNSLHVALKQNHQNTIHYVTQLIKFKTNVRHPNVDQLTPIHLACLNNKNDIIKLLLNQSRVNVIDDKHKTPLMYLIENQNIEMIQHLLGKDTFVDYQDIYGNSVLHYAIATQDMQIIDIVLRHVQKYDVVNNQGNTPLHFLLKTNKYINQQLVKKTNLNIQDNDGNTIIHLLVLNNKWQDYIDILTKKKLNINLKNADSKTALDLVDNRGEFIAMVTLSYYNLLQHKNNIWIEKWENQCNALKEPVPKSKDECLRIIKQNLNIRSVPFNKDKYCVNVSKPDKIEISSFTGISLDVVCGCLLLNTPTLLTRDFVHNQEISDYYTSLGFIKSVRTEFLNFEIMWIYNKLFFPTHMNATVSKFQASKKRFLIMPLGIELSHGAHANVLIYDKEKNTIERFEPNGSDPPYQFYYRPLEMDKEIEKYFKGITYIKPSDYLPKIGFQGLEEHDTEKRIGDPGGFCVAWCMWYSSQKTQHPDIEPRKLVKKLIHDIRIKNIKFKTLIRSFAQEITQIRQDILQNIDINDWINNTVTDNDIKNVISSIARRI